MRHVDFMVAFDGPVIEGVIPHVIDDLIVCEDCLIEAGALVNLGDLTALQAELTHLQSEIAETQEKLAGLKAYTNNLEESAAQRRQVMPLFGGRSTPSTQPARRKQGQKEPA